MTRNGGDRPRARRRALSLTDRQLEQVDVALDWALVDTDDMDQRDVRRMIEAQAKVQRELARRGLDVLVARHPLTGTPVEVVGPVRHPRR